MSYYHNVLIQKVWHELKKLKQFIDFVLIGGWAVYLYTQRLKSKDIDIIIDYDQLEKLRQEYQVFKNERLKKYEARKEDIQIDVYLPYYSNIGIPIEDLIKHTKSLLGFTVLKIEYLLAVKMYACYKRQDTSKGRKDLADIIALWQNSYKNIILLEKIIQKYSLENCWHYCKKQIQNMSEFSELGFSRHDFAKFKKSFNLIKL